MHGHTQASYVGAGDSNLVHHGYVVSVLTPQVISSSPDSIFWTLEKLEKRQEMLKAGNSIRAHTGKNSFSGLAGKMKACSLPHSEFLVPGNTSCG